MQIVKLTTEEVADRAQAMGQTGKRLIELEEMEEGVKAENKERMAEIKKERLAVQLQFRSLMRAVTLGVEERDTQQPLFVSELADFHKAADAFIEKAVTSAGLMNTGVSIQIPYLSACENCEEREKREDDHHLCGGCGKSLCDMCSSPKQHGCTGETDIYQLTEPTKFKPSRRKLKKETPLDAIAE